MNTILTVVLQISGGLRTEVNSFLSEYAVPVIAMLLIVGVGIGVVMNYDKIIDRDGQGTRNEYKVFSCLLYYSGCAGSVCRGLSYQCHERRRFFLFVYCCADDRGVAFSVPEGIVYQPVSRAQIR